MKVSLATVLDELNIPCADIENPADYPFFDWAKMFISTESHPDPSYFYVALLSEYTLYKKSHFYNHQLYCICLKDCELESDIDEVDSKMFLAEDDISLPELFNRVQNVFIRLNQWEQDMKDSVLADKGIQDLLDISEPILKNHVSVMDNTFALIAHSRFRDCDDPVVVEFVKNGYHPDEMIQKLIQYGHIAYYKRSNEIYVDRSYKISKYVGLEKAFSFDGTFTTQVVMNCNVKYTPSTYVLFQELIQYIKYYVDGSDNKMIMQTSADPTALLLDILEGRIKDNDILLYRTRRINLPANGCFNVYLVSALNTDDIPIQRISHEIQQILGSSTTTLIISNRIILLNQYLASSRESQNNTRLERLTGILSEHNLSCGVSSFFEHIDQFKIAVEQADNAYRNLAQNMLSIPTNDLKFYANYEDTMLFDFIRSYFSEKEDLIKITSSYKFLLTLQEYDKTHHSQNINLLRCYLAFNGNAAKAAAQCHMHRNNALYHINKMREQVGEKFDDPLFKEQLMAFLKLEVFN